MTLHSYLVDDIHFRISDGSISKLFYSTQLIIILSRMVEQCLRAYISNSHLLTQTVTTQSPQYFQNITK